MAQDAATASGIGGRASRPNTTSRPSRSRTAHTHRRSPGHECSGRPAIAAEMSSVPTLPSGISPAASASGLASSGRAAARASRAAISAGRRGRPDRSGGGMRGGPTPAISRVPAADIAPALGTGQQVSGGKTGN